MKAFHLIRNGSPEKAFELRDAVIPPPGSNEVIVDVEAFGINFADVMARLGFYRDCPPLPAVIGYEAVGRVREKSADVRHVREGDRVIAFTRFGGYAETVKTIGDGVAAIPDDYPAGKALALATQYCTAYYASHIATNVFPSEKVLIHAAAGGVGTALVQLCRLRDCEIYGTAGSDFKINYLKDHGVDHAINYRQVDFSASIDAPLDVVFDSIGGDIFKKGIRMLNRGGRMVTFGAASQADKTNLFSKLKFGLAFGIYHPVQFIMESRSLIGVNMLRIADHRSDLLGHCLSSVVELALEGKLDPHVGGMYPASDLARVHRMVQERCTMGKIGMYWGK